MSQTMTLSFSEKMKVYKERIIILDSIRSDLLVMEFNDEIDRSDEIVEKLHQLKEYSIYEA